MDDTTASSATIAYHGAAVTRSTLTAIRGQSAAVCDGCFGGQNDPAAAAAAAGERVGRIKNSGNPIRSNRPATANGNSARSKNDDTSAALTTTAVRKISIAAAVRPRVECFPDREGAQGEPTGGRRGFASHIGGR